MKKWIVRLEQAGSLAEFLSGYQLGELVVGEVKGRVGFIFKSQKLLGVLLMASASFLEPSVPLILDQCLALKHGIPWYNYFRALSGSLRNGE